MFDSGIDENQGFSFVSASGGPDSALVRMLMANDIVPGSEPGYELCKTIHAYHPLGLLLTDGPITLAQSQRRIINVEALGESRLVDQFNDTWDTIGRTGATVIAHNILKTSRIYGISSLVVGEHGKDPSTPLEFDRIADADLYFNVLDPLNTAGSLVLNQDPNSADFLKPKGIFVNGQPYHRSRTFVKMNEQPLYIEWTSSAFGFVGRSIYQRALFPLKTFLQSEVTDQMVVQKVGLLVAKMKSPGSFIDNVIDKFFGWKRAQIKAGVTGQVLSIGVDEDVASLNFQNLEAPYKLVRENVLKNIASACGMPATLIAQETMSSEMHEGSEDAKKEAAYLTWVRADAQALYDYLDAIVMRKAWTKEFYESLKADFPEYLEKPFETALHEWILSFEATWPNLLEEPDSEKAKTADVQMKSVIAMLQVLMPELDPESKAKVIEWAAENANERPELFAAKLDIDLDDLTTYLEENREMQEESAKAAQSEAEQAGKAPAKPRPFAAAS